MQDKYKIEWEIQKGEIMIEQEHLEWLLHIPSTDGNFISHLKQANLDTLRECLKSNLTKTARITIEREIRRR